MQLALYNPDGTPFVAGGEIIPSIDEITESLSSTYVTPAKAKLIPAGPPRAAGAVCFTWDDGYPNWLSLATEAYNRGQRHTFCVQTNRIDAVGGIPAADVLAIYNMGHEIASHGVSHINHATATSAQRAAEYDNSRTALEAIVGAGNVTTYVYPYGGTARNNATDTEAWGRYDRIRDTSNTGWTAMDDRHGPFLIPSAGAVLRVKKASIRRCARQPMIYNTYNHNPGGLVGGQPDITWAEAMEMMDYANTQGVPCITMRDAYPGGCLISSPTFKTGDLGGWLPIGDIGAASVVPMVNPPTGIGDAYCARVTTTTTQFSGFRELIPVTPGKVYMIGVLARIGANGAGGTLTGGTVYVRFGNAIDYAGNVSGWDASETITTRPLLGISSGAGLKDGSWNAVGKKLTVPAGRRFAEIEIGITGEAGITAEFAHIWVGEERFGMFS